MAHKLLLGCTTLALLASTTMGVSNAGTLIEQSKPSAAAQTGAAVPGVMVKVWVNAAGTRSALSPVALQKSSDGTMTPDNLKPKNTAGSKATSWLKHMAIGLGASTGHPAAQAAAQAAAMAEAKAQESSYNPQFTMKATWSMAGDSAGIALSERRPTFDISYASMPQMNGTALVPVVVKLAASDEGLVAGTTELRMQKQQMSTPTFKFVDSRIASHVQSAGKNKLKLVLDEDLQSGQYAVLFRPKGDSVTIDMTAAAQMMQGSTGAVQPWQIAWQFAVK